MEDRTPTEYRAVSDGYNDFLQYKVTKEVTQVFGMLKSVFTGKVPKRKKTVEEWHNVPAIYYHWLRGRHSGNEHIWRFELYVNSAHHSLKRFIEKWPHIEIYLIHYEAEVLKLMIQGQAKCNEANAKKGTVTKLT